MIFLYFGRFLLKYSSSYKKKQSNTYTTAYATLFAVPDETSASIKTPDKY